MDDAIAPQVVIGAVADRAYNRIGFNFFLRQWQTSLQKPAAL